MSNSTIKFLRGTYANRKNGANKSKIVGAGQPLFETDTKKLYIGEDGPASDLTDDNLVVARPINHTHSFSEVGQGEILPIAKGGTGANSPAEACANLGISTVLSELQTSVSVLTQDLADVQANLDSKAEATDKYLHTVILKILTRNSYNAVVAFSITDNESESITYDNLFSRISAIAGYNKLYTVNGTIRYGSDNTFANILGIKVTASAAANLVFVNNPEINKMTYSKTESFDINAIIDIESFTNKLS